MLWWTLRQLKATDPATRSQAAIKLGNSRNPKAVSALVEALLDPETSVRRAAAEALGMIRDPGTVDGLLNALSDRDSAVQEAAAEALVYLGADRTKSNLQAWFEQNQGSRERIRSRIQKSIDEIRRTP